MPTHRAGRKHRKSKHDAMHHREDFYTEVLVNIPSVAANPYRLRVTKAPANIPDSLEGAGGAAHIDGDTYVGFTFHSQMTQAFLMCRELGYSHTRIVDPYSIYVTVGKHQSMQDVVEYFEQFGVVCSAVVHDGKYAFINFRNTAAALCALAAGRVHRIGGMNCKIRAKVLSRSDPYAPKGYSPARWT